MLAEGEYFEQLHQNIILIGEHSDRNLTNRILSELLLENTKDYLMSLHCNKLVIPNQADADVQEKTTTVMAVVVVVVIMVVVVVMMTVMMMMTMTTIMLW